jgi:hypothetical protein
MMERIRVAVESGAVWSSVSSSIPLWWLIFVPFSFLPMIRRTTTLNFGLLMFGVTAVVVYYAIKPSLWGFAKYQAEYAAPMAISGLLLVMVWVNRKASGMQFAGVCLAALLAMNVKELINPPHLEQISGHNLEIEFDSVLESPALKSVLAAVPYEYKNAYSSIKRAGLDGVTYSIGATYGVLPEIMNGYTVGALRTSYDIYIGQEANRQEAMRAGVSIDKVESDNRIEAVMIGAISGKQKLIDDFSQRGWKEMAKFRNMQYGTTVLIMRKPMAAPLLPVKVS